MTKQNEIRIYVAQDGTEFNNKEECNKYNEVLKSEDEEFKNSRLEFLKIKKEVLAAYEKMYEFQENCPHTYLKIKARSDTGNYDPSQDSYWYEIECKCCGSRWNEDQKNSKYKSSNPNIEWLK